MLNTKPLYKPKSNYSGIKWKSCAAIKWIMNKEKKVVPWVHYSMLPQSLFCCYLCCFLKSYSHNKSYLHSKTETIFS